MSETDLFDDIEEEEEETPLTVEKERKRVLKKFPKVFKQYDDPFTIVSYGAKNTGKSLLAYAMNHGNASFAVIDFDGNSRTTLTANLKKKHHKNFEIWNIKKKLNFRKMRKDKITEYCYNLTQELEKIMDEVENLQPNFVVLDGYQRWVWVAENAGRFLQERTAFGGADYGVWKQRNFDLDRLYQACKDAARDAVVITVHERASKLETNQDGTPKAEPNWSGDLKEEAQIEIHHRREIEDVMSNEVVFYADVMANKMTQTTKLNIDMTNKPYEFFDWFVNTKSSAMF